MIAAMLLLLAALSVIAWIVVVFHRAPPHALLPDGDAVSVPEPAPGDWPSVTVIVPARNEEATLPLTLPRLLALDYPGRLRVIVVDERSTDRTLAVARSLGADAVEGADLPAGWAGKPWGMQQGLREAGVLDADERAPAFVLFTDADISHEPRSLRILVAEAVSEGLDLDSRMALLRCESPAEKLLIPAFLFFFATLYPMRRVSDPRSPVAASAGGCQLVRSATLQRMGGVEPVASRRIDDVSLAGAIKERGGHLRLACSRTQVRSLRAYPEIADVWRMVRRSAFEELRFSWWRLAACLAALALVFVVPAAALLSGDMTTSLLGVVAWAASATAYLPAVAHFGLPAWRSITLPIAGVLYGAMTVDSAVRHARRKPDAWRAGPGG